ncbi:hypothetical protein EJ110_NYTH38684 [Nymphaea thermarum]|nr:hypothetical protein EJ110_NYTH38684 [Nymphaea thermarum]
MNDGPVEEQRLKRWVMAMVGAAGTGEVRKWEGCQGGGCRARGEGVERVEFQPLSLCVKRGMATFQANPCLGKGVKDGSGQGSDPDPSSTREEPDAAAQKKKKAKLGVAVTAAAAMVAAWMRGQWDVAMCLGDIPLSPLVSPVRSAGSARPQGSVVCCLGAFGSLLPNLGVLGKAEYLSLEFTHPGLSALPLQRMKWIHTVMGHHGGCLSMEYQHRGKKCAELSTEAQREPSPAHSDAHTPHEDSTSGQQNAQDSVGAQTPPRQTPLVDQQAILLTTLQTLTSLVQLMEGNQRSQASPTGDTTAPPKEKATTVSFQHFMLMQPPVVTGDGSPDKAEEWIEEVECIFEVLEVPGSNKVNYGLYILKGGAKRWWKSTQQIQFAGQQSISWRQFRDSFFSTYFPAHARNKKMQEFLDLQQNHLSLEEYVAKVMSSRPRNMDEAVTMARYMEEDWARTQRDHQKKTSQHTQGGRMPVKHQHPLGIARPYERRDDRTFRRNRPGRSETTQGSMASPTSPRCPTCSRVHPEKPCYRVTGACLHCGECGLEEAISLAMQPINGSLVHAVAERWNPRTNTFWFPWGEMTITLDEFSNIMGLPEPKDSIEGCVFALQAWFYKHVGPQSCHFRNTDGQLSSMEHYRRKMEEVDDSTIIWDFFDREVTKALFRCFPRSLEGIAAQWYREHINPVELKNFDKLINLFIERFIQNVETTPTITTLCYLKQRPGEKVRDFIQRWRSSCNRMRDPMSQSHALGLIVNNLTQPLRSLISNAPIKSFIDLTERAECIEAGIENEAFDAVIPVKVREDTKKNSKSQNALVNIVANAAIFKKENSEYPKNKGVMDRASGSSSGTKNKHPG